MKEFEEIKETIENFCKESKQINEQIAQIEKQRNELAQERNIKKYADVKENTADIDVLGKQISDLGNKSQELQNKLNKKFYNCNQIVELRMDNAIAEGIRKIRKITENKKEYEQKIILQEERKDKYKTQKQEFFERFGRVPELSKNARIEYECEERKIKIYKEKIIELENLIEEEKQKFVKLEELKNNFANKRWSEIIGQEVEEETVILPYIEKIQEEFEVERPELIEEVTLQEFEPIIEEFEVKEFEPLELEEMNVQPFEMEKEQDDIIEQIARTIVEQIVEEQTKQIKNDLIEEQEKVKIDERKLNIKEEVRENIKLVNIMVEIENGELVYKAQTSNKEEIRIKPTKSEFVLLNIKEKREKIENELIDYAIMGYRPIDKNIIKKIDPIICELLKQFSIKYNYYDENDLIYDYAMTFSASEVTRTNFIPITYNCKTLNQTNLSKIEKSGIKKICTSASKNKEIVVIGERSIFNSIKHAFKRLFAINSVERLPEGKY